MEMIDDSKRLLWREAPGEQMRSQISSLSLSHSVSFTLFVQHTHTDRCSAWPNIFPPFIFMVSVKWCKRKKFQLKEKNSGDCVYVSKGFHYYIVYRPAHFKILVPRPPFSRSDEVPRTRSAVPLLCRFISVMTHRFNIYAPPLAEGQVNHRPAARLCILAIDGD